MLDNQQRLFWKLQQGTREYKLDWEPTSVGEQYALRMRSGTVLFDKFPEDDEHGEYYKFMILDGHGSEVDVFFINGSDMLFDEASAFYLLVGRQVSHADQTIDSLIAELEEAAGSAKADLDNIPF